MNLHTLIPILESIAPPALAEDFDTGRIGLILDRAADIQKIAVALDPTDYVLEEAARHGADLLITHHTLIFDPVNLISKKLSDTLKIAIDNDISIYVMHTNYDKAEGGVNDVLAELLGLANITPLALGRIGGIVPVSAKDFASFISKKLDTAVQYAGDREIKKVMVVGGSGFRREYIDIAIEHGADALVSGELRHDAIRYAAGELCLFDATHYATENPAMEKLCGRLPVDAVFIEDKPLVNFETDN
ncbi:MAG: Nif3-like dinuclear metal center hexameric protein [Candidatus Methanoperedens sp.]|jgi:dinuclear metal center YbgI/SA1388 family protein|nr:Nif3-like dinuclear metal center hexameric protein [Candidatus Methanoperedens sp.]PKL52753.1 MAG: Nif3-like dinuclear metal center hexameric protein [Candidatus Methanoperedenaceae archaeon HGW-Methanoperedenaceae-1]